MSAGTYLGLCLSLLVIYISAASDQQILRHPGMSVNLTFQVPTGTTSLWLKRFNNEKYISYCRDGQPPRSSDQEESFKDRVEGMDCSNISGTVSVTLKNLTRNDSGTYVLQRVDCDGRLFNKTVFLNITDPGQTGGHTEDGDTEGREHEAGASRGHTLVAISLLGVCVVVLMCVCCCIRQSAAIKWVKNCFKKNSPFSPLPNNEANRELQQSANNSLV